MLGGVSELSCDQVSPKKAIPMAPKPKSWTAGCGVVMGDGHTGRDANVAAGLEACQLVLDLVDIPPFPWEQGKNGASSKLMIPPHTPPPPPQPGRVPLIVIFPHYLSYTPLHKPVIPNLLCLSFLACVS